MVLACFLLIVSLVAAAGTFAYSQYLKSVSAQKATALADAQASVDVSAVEDFVHFRDRFAAAKTLLDGHVVASHFFDLLEELTLANVRFSSLNFERVEDGTVTIKMSGIARSFNALAAQSSAFANEKQIKRAIFANIKVAENGTVSFSVSAELDPKLIAFTDEGLPAQTPAAPVPGTTTPVSATTTQSSSGPLGTTTQSMPPAAPLTP